MGNIKWLNVEGGGKAKSERRKAKGGTQKVDGEAEKKKGKRACKG